MDIPTLCKVTQVADQQQSYETALKENPLNAPQPSRSGRQKRGVAYHSRLWAPGRTLLIAFAADVPEQTQQSIFEVACQWLAYANLKFQRTADWAEAQIRIEMKPSGTGINHSLVGTDALLREDSTMTLSDWPDDEQFQRSVLHEFGHALGLDHEHQHPDADIQWNLAKLLEYAEQVGMPMEEIAENFLNRIERTQALHNAYDPGSVMHYPIPATFTLNNVAFTGSAQLSDGDKALAGKAYPFTPVHP